MVGFGKWGADDGVVCCEVRPPLLEGEEEAAGDADWDNDC